MNIGMRLFMMIITGREYVARLPSTDSVYRITKVDLIPFDKNISDYR